MRKHIESIGLGGGCFWCTEAVYKELKGVVSVTPGYAGGIEKDPTYESVSTHNGGQAGTSGHAEVIRVEYDPDQISTDDILTVFFASHDPTTPNRQGNDVGPQYRSIILFTTEEQRQKAEELIREINNSSSAGGRVVTELKPFDTFYPAEEYHRDYYQRNPEKAYCQLVINPKLEKVQEKFAQLLKQE